MMYLLEETNMFGAKPAGATIEQNHKYRKWKFHSYAIATSYQRPIGKLIYLTIT